MLLDAARHAGNWTQAAALADRLGGFPLALHTAGLALAQPTARYRTFDAYREALDAELEDILAVPYEGTPTQHQRRTLLRYTWELSLDQLADEGYPLARPLLRMLSLAADAPLPRDLITPELLGGSVTRAAVDGALEGLHRYGLTGILTNHISCVTLHPLVREINALLLDEEADVQSWQDTLDRILLADAERTAASDHTGWRRAHVLAPHVAPILARLGDRPEAVLAALDTVNCLADVLHDAGDAIGEHWLLPAILDMTRTIRGPDHVDTLSCRSNLAVALHALGEHRSAAQRFEQILEDYERVLGPDHVDAVGCRNNLAIAWHAVGRRLEAVTMLERTLADYQRVLAPDHPDTLAVQSNLAEALRDVPDLEWAARLFEENVTDREKVLGADHPTSSPAATGLPRSWSTWASRGVPWSYSNATWPAGSGC